MKLKLKLFAIFILVIMLASVIPAALSDNPSLSIDSYWINGQDKITLQKGQETKFTVNVDLMPQGMNLEVDPVYIETNMFKKGKSEIFHNWVDLPNWKTNFQEVFTVDTSLDKYTPGEYIISTIVTEEDNSYTEQEITLTLLPAQGQEILGCTDPDAENFEPEATENDGSCIYEQPCEDKDDDGVCDEDDICPDEPGPKENDGCPEDDNEKPEFYDNLNDKYIITETETLYLPILIEDEQENSLEVGYKKCSAWDFFELFCTVEDWNQDYQLEETSENHFMFSWTPDYTYVKHPGKTKNIDLIFTASDGDLSTKKEIKILVKDKNQLPEVDFYNLNSPFEENKPVAILAVTDDKDTEDELTIIKTTQPIWLNAEVDDGDIIFTGTPDCDSSGHHSISITVTDGIDEVTENHFFKVEETCDLPCEDTDEDGICDVDEVLGCTDPEAENFNPEATEEDNSCEYLCPDHDNDGVCDVDEKWGCTDPEAENFNPDATEGDNSCTYEQPCEDHDKDGICDQDEVFGCTNENALNFDPDATEEDGTCELICPDHDKDGICDEDDLCPAEPEDFDNFEDEDGCPEEGPDGNQPPQLLVDGENKINEGEELSLSVTVNDESASILSVEVYEKRCFLFVCINSNIPEGAQLTPVLDETGVFTWTPDFTFVKHPGESRDITFLFKVSDGEFTTEEEIIVTVSDVNQLPEINFEGNDPVNEDEELIITVTAEDADKEDEVSLINVEMPEWLTSQLEDSTLIITGTPVCNQAGNYEVIVTVSDGINEVVESYSFEVLESCDLPCEDTDEDGICDVDEVLGCTDPEAENFNPEATEEDNSCEYLCEDTDEDGICDVDDLCPLDPEDFDNYEDEDGCPEDNPQKSQISSKSLKFISIGSNPEPSIGESFPVVINIGNNGKKDLKKIKVTATIYELGLVGYAYVPNLDVGNHQSLGIVFDIPNNIEPGEYSLKVSAYSDYTLYSTNRVIDLK